MKKHEIERRIFETYFRARRNVLKTAYIAPKTTAFFLTDLASTSAAGTQACERLAVSMKEAVE